MLTRNERNIDLKRLTVKFFCHIQLIFPSALSAATETAKAMAKIRQTITSDVMNGIFARGDGVGSAVQDKGVNGRR